jgi:ATP-binding cassette, subfamily B, multidrug efflux pump
LFSYLERLLDPFPPRSPKVAPKTIREFIWNSTTGTRRFYLALTLITALVGAFEALLFSFMGKVVDWISTTPPAQLWSERGNDLLLLAALLVASIGVAAVQAGIKYQVLFSNFPMRLRWDFHRWMLSQSLAFYQDEFAGRIATKVMQTALAVRAVLVAFCDLGVFLIIYFFTMAGLVGGFKLWLLAPFFAWLGLYIILLRYFVPKIGDIGKLQADARSTMTGRIADAYSNITTVKLFSHHEREAAYAKESMQEFLGTAYAQMRLATQFEIANATLSVAMILGTSGLVLYFWSRGEVGPGAVAAATAMAMRLNGISHWIMWEMSTLFENIGTVKDGITMFSQPLTVEDLPDARPLKVEAGEVHFEDVSFGYRADSKVFTKLNLTIRAGEKIALVGPSGAGKSTLTNLLLRLYDIQGGRILIDGQDISKATLESLQENIAMVTQDTSLLHRSISDNLRYGRPEASDHDIRRAAQEAEAEKFIELMQDPSGRTGFDAHVGERGVKLSGGQRQRIAIARVILKNAPILVLDEATSALDSEVEAAIQESLGRLMKGKTVLAIAHRLSTIAAMDRLIVMDQGQIVEIGSHQELLERKGLYARLWNRQSGGFLALKDEQG